MSVSASVQRHTRYAEPTIVLEVDVEGAAYLAEVLREHQPNDHGARDIAEVLERAAAEVTDDE